MDSASGMKFTTTSKLKQTSLGYSWEDGMVMLTSSAT